MATVRSEYERKDTFMRRWAAVFILTGFFLFSWGGQFIAQQQEMKQDAKEYGQEFQMSEFWPGFWSATFENWQSEWLQLTTQAILIAALADQLFRKGNQDHYKTQLMIEALQKQLRESKRSTKRS